MKIRQSTQTADFYLSNSIRNIQISGGVILNVNIIKELSEQMGMIIYRVEFEADNELDLNPRNK